MFFDINKSLCDGYSGLDPIRLLDYPAEDVFDLINGFISHGERNKKEKTSYKGRNVERIRKPAGDNWF